MCASALMGCSQYLHCVLRHYAMSGLRVGKKIDLFLFLYESLYNGAAKLDF